MTVVSVALGWGGLVLALGGRLVRRVDASERARRLRPAALESGKQPDALAQRVGVHRVLDRLGPLGRVARGWARRRAGRRRDEQLARELPAAIDLLAVAVSAGSTPYGAMQIAARWAPPTIGDACANVITTCKLGAAFESALQGAGLRDRRLAPLTAVLATGARLGAAVNDALVRLASESRRDLRRRSEARARTVPVRLLFPLVFLVLPAFGLLTVVPAVAAGFRGF
jgi:hypothetical protein